MGKRRLAHVSSSDEEDNSNNVPKKNPRTSIVDQEEEEQVSEEQEEDTGPDLKPLGDVLRKTGRGRAERNHFSAFELDGNRYELEDPVLITPEEKNQKPYVAIIKDIKQSKDDSIAVTGQWFYRPEEADKKGGGNWQSCDARELFYSFHVDDVPAESVMHKCVVHFIPTNKQLPVRSKNPGFIVQKVYDTVQKKLWNLTDKDYEDSKQKEIDLLVDKTRAALGELPDIASEEVVTETDEVERIKRQLRRKALAPLVMPRDDEATGRSDPIGKPETPGHVNADGHAPTPAPTPSEPYAVLSNFSTLTGVKSRDRWLEKIIQDVKHACDTKENGDDATKQGEDQDTLPKASQQSVDDEEAAKDNKKVESSIPWPEAAIAAVSALEKAAYESLGNDNHKYNIKMRSMDFNLKNNSVLARRLLKGELEPSTVLNMSPAELKDGLTTEEKTAQEPQEIQTMQMADVRCSICSEKKVGVRDIIHVGYGDRYQLECLKCGNSWYASRDSISSLTIETINPVTPVGTVTSATVKFDEVEKMMSPRETEKLATGGSGQKEETLNAAAPETCDAAPVETDTKHEENKSPPIEAT